MKKILSLVLFAVMATVVMGVPARKGGVVRTAEDGTQKMVYLHGDKWFHYTTDAEGNWLDEETLQPLSEEMKNEKLRIKKEVQARRIKEAKQMGGELNLAPRGLLIMVNFKDKEFTTPFDTIHEMINGESFTRDYSYDFTYQGTSYHFDVQSSGSARQYFHDQSWGQYNPQFDVVGPYTLSQNYSYYGKNDDANVGYMIKEACELADKDGVDFTLYDNNSDKKVDFVYVLYAGYGEADGGPENTVWPHNYDLRYMGVNCTVDGKTIRNYACSNEISYYSKLYNGIGTFCHEFSHVLGLPDLYETNNPLLGLHTLLDWDILDYGPYNNDGNTPPAYSAYERFYMGWLTPRVLKDPEYVRLNPLNESQEALLLCEDDEHNLVGNDPNPTTFYLLENRKKEGWDEYLPGRGMLITKIKYNYSNWYNNKVNNSSSNMGVDIMEATSNTSDRAAAKDAFPAGAKNWTAFTNHEITGIKLTGGVIEFSYRGGEDHQAVENVASDAAATKVLRDGKVLIIRNGVTYDLTGQMLDR